MSPNWAANRSLENSHQSSAQPLRVLIDNPSLLDPAPDSLDLVDSPLDAFDVLVLTTPYDAEEFRQLISGCANPLAPLIADASFGERADYVLRFGTGAEIVDAANSLAMLARTVAEVPAIPRGVDRDGLIVLGSAHTRQKELTATWQPGHRESVRYSLLRGVEHHRGELERLADLGLLRRRYFDRLHICNACQSTRVHAREVCCVCKSSDLVEHDLLHHYACGLQAPEEMFAAGGALACPKCRKPLKHYGVEYDKPGQVISCATCDATLAEPDVSFVCGDCGQETDSDDCDSQRFYHYTITSRGVDALLAGTLPAANRETSARYDQLLEFRSMVQNYVHIATRGDRPLTMVRVQLQRAEGPTTPALLQQLYTLVLETARNGDAVALADDCVLACLPETDTELSQPLLQRVAASVAKQLPSDVDVVMQVVPRDQVLETLRACC